MSGKKKTKQPSGPIMQRAPPQGIDLQQAFGKLVGNTATIAQHCQAMKLVAKGIDVEPIEKANAENQNLLVAFAQFIQAGPPGQKTNRVQRRKAAREAKKLAKKRKKR